MSLAILGLGTAVPPLSVTQDDASRIARAVCCRTKEQETWLPVMYDHTGIRSRHLIFGREVVEDILRGTTLERAMETNHKVEFENERVRVSRVRRGGRGSMPHSSRHDRLIIYLRDSHIARTEGGRREEIRRKAGDVVWRGRSQHTVEVLEEGDHEVLIIEFLR